jgi:hypothetical protein
MIGDRRLHARRIVHIPAKLMAGTESPLRDCVLVDISEYGARLEIEAAQDTPDNFTILLAPGHGPFRQCHVVWRGDGQLGVAFDKSHSSQVFPEPPPQLEQ